LEDPQKEENKHSLRVDHKNEQERKTEEQILENSPQKEENDGLVRWSTCVLVYFSWLLDHVIYLKLRRE
jgi:hypothetical protein